MGSPNSKVTWILTAVNGKGERKMKFERNHIYNMDCIAGMSIIPDGEVDMIFTDLPYGVTDCAWDSLLPLPELWAQYERVIKPNGAIVLTACQPFTTALIQSNRRHFRYCWYWHKNTATGFCFAKFQPMRCMEDVAVFYRKAPVYHPQGVTTLGTPAPRKKAIKEDCVYKMETLGKAYTQKYTGYPKNLLEIRTERGLHPTQKPVALVEYMVRTYTNPGELVLDSCGGSGTTAEACIRSGRDYILFEIDEGYFNIAQERARRAEKQADTGEG